jgi:hypothetical protein
VIGGVVLDATSLADLAENRTAYAGELVDTAIENLRVVCVPSVAWQECWQRSPEKSQAFFVMFGNLSVVVVEPHDYDTALDAGDLAVAAGEPEVLAGTAHAVLLARTRGWPILTAQPDVVRALDSNLAVEELP